MAALRRGEKKKKRNNMASAARRFAEENLCVWAKREVGRERRAARVALGRAGERGQGSLMSHSAGGERSGSRTGDGGGGA